MHIRKIRPRFKIETPVSITAIKERLQNKLNDPRVPFTGTIASNYVIINIPEEQSHFWSPRLTLDCEENGNKTIIKGMFGPRPVVWMMFMGFYLAAMFLMFVGLMWGGAQWSLGMKPTGLIFSAIGAVIFILAYISALFGQKLSEKQMHDLRDFLEDTLRISTTLPEFDKIEEAS